MIRAVVFDLGGVILTNDWDRRYLDFFMEFGNHFHMSLEDMQKGWELNWSKFRVGRTTEEEFWTGFLKETSANPDVEAAKEIWRKHQRPLENMTELIEKLNKNYMVAALTNISREWLEYKRKKYNLDHFFKPIVSSGYTGVAKADPEIYKLLLGKLGFGAGVCVFIDDKEKNLEPARRLGMKTIPFTGRKDLEKKLCAMGVEF